jgi:hypothetical protein
MENPKWIGFKKEYSEMFKVDPVVIDYIAVEPILQFVVSGFDNEKIATILELDLEYVSVASQEFLDYFGNISELEFNPLYYYKSVDNEEDYLVKLAPYVLDNEAHMWYTRCTAYTEIRRKVNEFYGTP